MMTALYPPETTRHLGLIVLDVFVAKSANQDGELFEATGLTIGTEYVYARWLMGATIITRKKLDRLIGAAK